MPLMQAQAPRAPYKYGQYRSDGAFMVVVVMFIIGLLALLAGKLDMMSW